MDKKNTIGRRGPLETSLELEDMRTRISEELFDILTPEERKNFNPESALQRINRVFKGAGNVLI